MFALARKSDEDRGFIVASQLGVSFSRSYFTIKVILLVVSWLPCFSLGAFFEGETQYLERGQQGVVPCPSLSGARLTPEDVDATYWHRGPIYDTSAVVINYYGDISPGPGVLAGLYNITEDLSLVINQVLDSTAGTYYCRLAPIKIAFQDSSVPVRVIVSPHVEFPEVAPCDKKPRPNQCDVSIPADQSRINLTCTVEHAYPQISLELSSLQDTAGYRQQWVQLTDNEINIHRVIVSPKDNLSELELLRTNNTFTTTTSVEVEVGVGFGVSIIVCRSSGTNPLKPASTLVVIRKENPVSSAVTHLPMSTVTEEITPSTESVSSNTTEHQTSDMDLVDWIFLGIAILFALLFLLTLVLFSWKITKMNKMFNPCKSKDRGSEQVPQLVPLNDVCIKNGSA